MSDTLADVCAEIHTWNPLKKEQKCCQPWCASISAFFLLIANQINISFVYESIVVKHYATNRKITGLIPDAVIFLNLPNPSGRTRPWGLLGL
jgi:hypothetical protein